MFLSGQENQQEKVSSLTFSFILFRQSTLCNFEFVVFSVGSVGTGTGNAKYFLSVFFSGKESWQEKEDECQVLLFHSFILKNSSNNIISIIFKFVVLARILRNQEPEILICYFYFFRERELARKRRRVSSLATWIPTGMSPLFSLLMKWIWNESTWM